MTAASQATVPASIADALDLDLARLTPRLSAVGIVAIKWHDHHVCRWHRDEEQPVFHCPDADEHDTLFRRAESTLLMPLARRFTCPACGRNTRMSGRPGEPVCFEIVQVPVRVPEPTEAATR